MKEARFQIGELLGIGMTLVVLAIGIAYGLDVMGDLRDDIGEDDCAARTDGFDTWNDTSKACGGLGGGTNTSPPLGEDYNATLDGIEGVSEIPERIPTIATIVVAAVIIGILVTYLWARFR